MSLPATWSVKGDMPGWMMGGTATKEELLMMTTFMMMMILMKALVMTSSVVEHCVHSNCFLMTAAFPLSILCQHFEQLFYSLASCFLFTTERPTQWVLFNHNSQSALVCFSLAEFMSALIARRFRLAVRIFEPTNMCCAVSPTTHCRANSLAGTMNLINPLIAPGDN